MQDTPAIAAARRAYMRAGELFETRITQLEVAEQALTDARARLNHVDELWNIAATAVDNTFEALRLLVAEAREAGQS